MPTTYTDQFWVMDPFAPPSGGTLLVVSSFDIIDNNDNNQINRFANDSIDGVDIIASYPGDTVTVDIGGTSVTFTGVTFYLQDGREVFTPTDDSILQDGTLVSTTFVTGQGSVTPEELEPICFTAGTLIDTVNGPRRVETLAAGDLVLTADRGLVAICFVNQRVVSAEHLRINEKQRPIRIIAGCLIRIEIK